MAQPALARATITDAMRLVVPAGHKAEVLDGRVIVTPAESWRGVLLRARLAAALRAALPADQYLVSEGGANFGDRTEYVIPDIWVVPVAVADAAAESDELLLDPANLVLAVEVVSASNRVNDYERKRDFYPRRGCPIYWILDPLEHRFTQVTPHGQTDGRALVSDPTGGLVVAGYTVDFDLSEL